MKIRFAAGLWRSSLVFIIPATLLVIIVLVGTTGCAASTVVSGTPSPAALTPSVAQTSTDQPSPVLPSPTQTTAALPTAGLATIAPTVPVTPMVAAPTMPVTPTAVVPTVLAPSPTDLPTAAAMVTVTRPAAPAVITAAPGVVTPAATATEMVVVEEAAIPARPDNVNPLTGLEVADKTVLQRRPLLVRIGNDPQIRPQTGLSAADLVYEDIMDGWWVTRLTGIFLSQTLEAAGPVRSARLVNLQMAPQFDGGLIHSGASDPIRWRLSQSGIVDLDEFFHREPYFYKQGVDWRGRLFVNLKLMRDYLQKQGLEKAVPLRGFVFSAPGDPALSGLPATELTIPFPKNSVVRFKYDPASGLYQRFVQGQAHLDALTNKQLTASNVVVQFVPHEKTDIVEDSQGTTSINITLLGEGKALIFRDGVVIPATWKTDNPKRMTRFLDEQGQPVAFKPGQTWIELVPPDYQIATAPAGPLGATGAVTATVSLTGSAPITLTAPATKP